MTPLERLLASYRDQTLSVRDRGTAFEKLIAAWLRADPVQGRRFRKVETWSQWAAHRKQSRSDTGIDLVATRHDGAFTAVQCKFFAADRRIRKHDIDSFLSASGKPEYAERLIVETTDVPWSGEAETMLRGQAIPAVRIGLRELRDSPVDWSAFEASGAISRPRPKTLRPDQTEAVEAVRAGLAAADRGKLIMACGAGKTLTSLRIAEEMAGSGGWVLFLVPSLALMAQTVRAWCADARLPLAAFAACSDVQVGRRRRSQDDVAEIEVTDLAFPATTDAKRLAEEAAKTNDAGETMRVVFATYQSISVIADAQAEHGLPEFDLIVCDEAHRTTGVTFAGEDQSNFVKAHDNGVIRGRKRLYMTATPRIYGEQAKSKARESQATLASMDDPADYGELLFHHGFARAVESDILTDYRVIVLAMDEGQVSAAVQQRLADEDSELALDDATKIVGCWKALSKIGLDVKDDDAAPMRRALAFCRSIRSSKLVREEFERVVSEFRSEAGSEHGVRCEVRHVDGTQNARERGKHLDWLKEDVADACRILSNARCLTEGVDVPALDAILFLHPRNSQIDVVQAVGRVMRKSPGKKMGYIILPVGIPPGVSAEAALNDNKKYRVVWQILNALRSHDERLGAVINQGGLGQDVSGRIVIVDGRELEAITAKVEDLPLRPVKPGPGLGKGGGGLPTERPGVLPLVVDDFSRAVMAKIVEKCGDREYWEDWAKDVARIAEKHVTRISSLVRQPGDAQSFFEDFLKELRDDLNESVTRNEAIEMLAQHLITRPVFEALFEGHEFVTRNPVSAALNDVLGVIDAAQVGREAKDLEGFYASVRRRAQGITDPGARQRLIADLYEKFFRGAFPRTAQRLGIVYTPTEIVDFIIHSVNDVLEEEFGETLGSRGVHILEPFVGTGTFITRLLQSGLIAPEDLERKYRHEIHANELVLLAYYIAAINIETVFHAVAGREEYLPFEGICLTDTFALHEGDDQLSFYMKDNTDRRERQKKTDIRVILGNPPYSFGQRSQDDNAKNVNYPRLDSRIRSTYAETSTASSLQKLYDYYVRAIRWGGDRLGEAGVMALVTGSGWVEGGFADGMRKCLAEEFASVRVFHLRGDIRKNILSGGRAREGDNVFDQHSMTGVAITVFVRNPEATEQGRILLHDIGDDLSRKAKLGKIQHFGGIRRVEWKRIVPDAHGDWLEQRAPGFDAHPKLGDKKDKGSRVLFDTYSCGVVTARDAWCVNPSRTALAANIRKTISFYNDEVSRWREAQRAAEPSSAYLNVDDFVAVDPGRFSWSHAIKKDIQKQKDLAMEDGLFVPCLHRPFTKQWQFFSRRLNDNVYLMHSIFPDAALPNRVIAVTGRGGQSVFSALMMDALPNYQTIYNGQCFPFWLYRKNASKILDTGGASRLTPSPNTPSRLSAPPTRPRRSRGRTSSTTSTACSTPRTTAAASAPTSPRSCRVSPA